MIIFFFSLNYEFNIDLFEPNYKNLVKTNKYFLSNYFKIINNEIDLIFNLTSIKYSIELKKRIVKVEYLIDFYDENKNIISPSDLTLYHKIHVMCYTYEIKTKTIITSVSNIYKNKHYYCIEFFNRKENVKFGIKIYKNDGTTKYCIIDFFSYKNKNIYKLIYYNKNIFNCELIKKDYEDFINKINKNNSDNSLKLKESYIQKPYCLLKNNIIKKNNEWYFNNIYNNYFCYCKGLNCFYKDIPQNYKYYFYLSIIDNNKNLYNKTDYLFGDFIYNKYSSDDVYPIFKEMIVKNLPVHYLTQNINIFENYCKFQKNCLSIIPIQNDSGIIDGDFLEKYLTLFLKLKVAISGAEFFFINNLFYNIDYITYISVGHGVSFFKYFLYADYNYYGKKIFNKILIPPSEIFISKAKNYGWEDENIIKMNLPRWDKYNCIPKKRDYNKYRNIFIMFTWREIRENKNISYYYIKNIYELLNNNLLNNTLLKKKIILYFSLHHRILDLKSKIRINKYIKYIEELQISNILANTSLIVTDFSSIIFDIIYREIPYVIFLPDSNDSTINAIYNENYYRLIKEMVEGKISFENMFFSVEEAVKKIIYYINNNFCLEERIKKFYHTFGLKKENSTIKFIEYLKNIN